MKDLQWFLDRVDSYILRGTTEIFIKSEEMAQELFEKQSAEWQFSEKVRVHRAAPEECESCSA